MESLSNNFYYSTICHFCKEISNELQRCSSCKSVAYCSKEHQKLDWRCHKALCKAIAVTNTNVNKFSSFQQWINERLKIRQKWIMILNRDLHSYESQIWMFPRVCAYCYSQSKLIDCSGCLSIAYCSNEHEKNFSIHHKPYCQALRLCLNIDLYLAKFKEYPKIRLKFNKNFPRNMNSLLDDIDQHTDTTKDISVIRALQSEALSLGSTILYVMHHFSLQNQNKCVIHLIGASAIEGTTDWILTSEILMHLFPDLTEIIYYLIGPEACNITDRVDLCRSCSSKGKHVTIQLQQCLYHEVVGIIEKPNYIFAFNCGFHEFEDQDCDQWHDSIPYLYVNDAPVVLTSYTKEESLRDLAYIRRTIPDIDDRVFQSIRNPFSSLRPVRDWCKRTVPVFYSNAYITIFN